VNQGSCQPSADFEVIHRTLVFNIEATDIAAVFNVSRTSNRTTVF
jgi:hypothetical protein